MNGWIAVTTAGVGVLAVMMAVLVVVLVAAQRRTRQELELARSVQDELLTRLSLLERPAIKQAPEGIVEFVISDVATPRTPESVESPARIEGRLFADIVARETVIKAASWTHGLRHALSAENRNRLRFEMRRESKRSARRRKADVKEALRQYYSRERGDVA